MLILLIAASAVIKKIPKSIRVPDREALPYCWSSLFTCHKRGSRGWKQWGEVWNRDKGWGRALLGGHCAVDRQHGTCVAGGSPGQIRACLNTEFFFCTHFVYVHYIIRYVLFSFAFSDKPCQSMTCVFSCACSRGCEQLVSLLICPKAARNFIKKSSKNCSSSDFWKTVCILTSGILKLFHV